MSLLKYHIRTPDEMPIWVRHFMNYLEIKDFYTWWTMEPGVVVVMLTSDSYNDDNTAILYKSQTPWHWKRGK